jgi:phosphonate transport system ATP-binding protein
MNQMLTAIILDRVLVQVAGRTVLQVPQLRIEAGERVAVVGPNGAGKSTLMRLLNGFVRPVQGRVQVLGCELTAPLTAPALRSLRARVGQVHQGLHLVARLSARENVLIGALARHPGWRSWARLYPPALLAEADAALSAVGLLGRANDRVDGLSGGERQKISLARLRLQRPHLILADEPTANLDPAAAQEACTGLRAAADAAPGITLLTVVHQPALLPLLAQRVIGLHNGRIVWDRPCSAAHAADLQGDLARLYAAAAPYEPTGTLTGKVHPIFQPLQAAPGEP